MRSKAVLCLLGLVLAGCLQPPQPPAEPGTPSGGAVPARFRLVNTGFDGGEPTLGVDVAGSIFVAVFAPPVPGPIPELQPVPAVARSDDGGASWRAVSSPPRTSALTFDPFLYLDPGTDRIFDSHLNPACSWLAWTDDGGASWEANPVGACPGPAHSHQKVSAGPPAAGTTTSGYPHAVYYAYNSRLAAGSARLGTLVSVSVDGGRTFSAPVVAHPNDPCHVGINGPVAVAPDGTAFLPKPVCEGLHVLRSRDTGASWEVVARLYDAGGSDSFAMITDAAVDADGNAYVVFPGKDGRIYLSASADGGTSWTPPSAVTPPDVRVATMPVVAAGSRGRVAVAYLGTASDPAGWERVDPSVAPEGTAWHLHAAFSEDALAAPPRFAHAQATPADDPVQVGCVWLRGGDSDCSNLLEFIDMVQREGRVHVAFTDGCDRCARAADSRGRAVAVALLEEGPSLLAGAREPAPPGVGARGSPSRGPPPPR